MIVSFLKLKKGLVNPVPVKRKQQKKFLTDILLIFQVILVTSYVWQVICVFDSDLGDFTVFYFNFSTR